MELPYFYINHYTTAQNEIVLDEDTSKHIVQVLRMRIGESLNLTDGKGNLLTCEIVNDHKKHCEVRVIHSHFSHYHLPKISIAISLLKNANRFEWFLEKATEIGVSAIIPLICERTEKEKFRFDRMKGICISAMLQSQQTWLPVLYEPMKFSNLVMKQLEKEHRFIAHCADGEKQQLAHTLIDKRENCQILIGPEGDFTKEEIKLALKSDYLPVSLGSTRLRTETAGVVAASLLCQI